MSPSDLTKQSYQCEERLLRIATLKESFEYNVVNEWLTATDQRLSYQSHFILPLNRKHREVIFEQCPVKWGIESDSFQ